MGDSLKEFLASRSRPLDDIPSEKYPEGHSYSFTAPPWKTCLTLKAIYTLGVRARAGLSPEPGEMDRLSEELLKDEAEAAEQDGFDLGERMYRKVMGATYDQLVEDGVDGDAMEAVFGLLIKKYGAGQDIALQLAEVNPAGEAPAQPNLPTPTVAEPQAGSSSSRASGATPARTRNRASTRGSKTPAKKAAAKKTA